MWATQRGITRADAAALAKISAFTNPSIAVISAEVTGALCAKSKRVRSALTSKVKAGELVNFVAGQVGGKGGGKPDLAMAGGTDASKLGAALQSVPAWVEAKL
jgi:alanyl-tRNA synthetase